MKIKFITLNIYNGNYLDKCIDYLKKEKADLFVLQEVYRYGTAELSKKFRSYEAIKTSFPEYHSFYSPEYFKNENSLKLESGNVIFSRFQIVESNTVFYAGEYRERKVENAEEFLTSGRNIQSVKLKVNGIEVNVFNTHGIWGFDGKDNPERLKMSQVIVEQIKNKKNVIMAGDFNLTPETTTIKNIEKHLKNIFTHSLSSTFNLEIKQKGIKSGQYIWKAEDLTGFAVSVVDMIFISPNIKVINKSQPKVDVSDHYPLVVEIEI